MKYSEYLKLSKEINDIKRTLSSGISFVSKTGDTEGLEEAYTDLDHLLQQLENQQYENRKITQKSFQKIRNVWSAFWKNFRRS